MAHDPRRMPLTSRSSDALAPPRATSLAGPRPAGHDGPTPAPRAAITAPYAAAVTALIEKTFNTWPQRAICGSAFARAVRGDTGLAEDRGPARQKRRRTRPTAQPATGDRLRSAILRPMSAWSAAVSRLRASGSTVPFSHAR